MTVETYTPNKTTTLETPVKILEDSPVQKTNGTRIGFVSLGWPKYKGQSNPHSLFLKAYC